MYGFNIGSYFSSLIVLLVTFFPGLSNFLPGVTPAPPADRIAPTVRVESPRGNVYDRDESLLLFGGSRVRATDNVGVISVTVELLRYPSATSTTPNGYYNWTTRTFVSSPSTATQTTATATTDPAIFRTNSFPRLAVGTTYAVRARARDAAGNTRTDVSRFTRRAGFSAQQTRITGRVTTSNGAPVVNLLVRSTGPTGTNATTRTDATGRYELVNISTSTAVNVVVTPDPTAGTFTPISRTVRVTSSSQGELGGVNFIRTQ